MARIAANAIAGFGIASLALSGCGGESPPPSRLERWTETISAVPQVEAAARIEELRAKEGLPLSFWAGETASQLAGVEAIRGEHPCGSVAIAFVERIPASEPGAALESELVAEIGPSGEPLRTWSVPVDTVVDGVRGEALLFSVSFDRGDAPPLSVRIAAAPDGSYRVEPTEGKLPVAEPADCPPLGLWGESAYLRCWRYRDAASGEARTIAYQGPCT